jgi:putative two-component system response regulator
LKMSAEIALYHHEKFDGTGYPIGIAGKDIPLSARIVALADVYDALVSKRVYKSALPHDSAKSIITAERGKHFDPIVVDAFIRCEGKFIEILEKFHIQ